MANPEHVEVVKKGREAILEWREANPRERLNLGQANLEEANLYAANLAGADLRQANLSEADVRQADLTGANLSSANLIEARLNKAKLKAADLNGALLGGAVLDDADLSSANLNWAKLIRAKLIDAKISGASLRRADLSAARLSGAKLNDADLTGSDLSHANLVGTILHDADLTDAVFLISNISGSTSFTSRTKFDGTTISRRWATILEASGVLSKLDIASMNIVDPVKKLRSTYSGFQQWIHLSALALFLFPYAAFFVRCLVIRKWFGETTVDGISMWLAFVRFVWSGGRDLTASAPFDSWAVFCFVLLLAYNALRGGLLWKVKHLELEEQITGLPAELGQDGSWNRLFKWSQWLFYASLVLVIIHTWRFLLLTVPVT